jgi:Zn-dependent protease
MLTAWLFGMAFAQSGRFLIEKKDASPRSLALITLTGPAISLVLSILFLPLVLFGGILGQIGMLGFTMNLVTVVYNLMPFTPMDGKSIFEWSKLFWALLFVPITLFFLVMTFFVLG